jgi:hypothetical protein
MLALPIIFAALFVLVAVFLLTPVILYIDTDYGRYEIFQSPVFRFYVVITNGMLTPKLRLFGIDVQLKSRKSPEPKLKEEKAKRKRMRKSLHAWRFLIERTLRSFTVRSAIADVDTGDVVLNAQLVPVFLFASRGPVVLNINFTGRVYFHLEVSNRPGRILWIFLKFLIKK